ncbi:hypothetical protein KUCAC02_031329 [Chaenocephalus aceratus]|uniref:Uncharacterized protein n=1 Tax=Chaenocephalus aceratus TaxID=36190 RepID=A0ACB9XMS8_CHAAC|nr:hypothetical protein KUCAC02_031329 [Chaenocephalus aceratus]
MPGGSTKKTCPFCQNIFFVHRRSVHIALRSSQESCALRRSSRGLMRSEGVGCQGGRRTTTLLPSRMKPLSCLRNSMPLALNQCCFLARRPEEGRWTLARGRVTLNLTPCDPSEPENNWQEAGTTENQVPETSTVQVEVLKTPPREAVHHHRGGAGGAAPAG